MLVSIIPSNVGRTEDTSADLVTPHKSQIETFDGLSTFHQNKDSNDNLVSLHAILPQI